jgi:hypothetical protein
MESTPIQRNNAARDPTSRIAASRFLIGIQSGNPQALTAGRRAGRTR